MISIEFVLSVATTPDADPSLFRPLLDWFNLDDPWRKWLVAFGLLGQMVFVARWIIQWVASERRGKSHVPELFWWCSILGSMMLLAYFIVDRDPVGVLGQSIGWTVYSRNLYLIRVKHRHRDVETQAGPHESAPSA